MRLIDLTGKKFHQLLVLKKTDPHVSPCGQKHVAWECVCSCGTKIAVTGHALRRGLTKSCGCLKNFCNKPDEYTPFRYFIRNAFSRYRRASSAVNKPITITAEDLKAQWDKQHGVCPYTGWKMLLNSHKRYNGKRQPNQASLDRIDSSKGYELGNIHFVSLMANYGKNSFDDDVLIHFCKAVALNHPNTHVANKETIAEIQQRIAEVDALGI